MLSTDVESCWAGIKGNREVDYLARCHVHSTEFLQFVSLSLLRYLKADKSVVLTMLYRGPVYLVMPRPLARVYFIIYCCD